MQSTHTDNRLAVLLPACGVGVAAFALYAATCAPGVLWGDSAAFQLRVWRSELENPLGLALAHPLYIVLARAWADLVGGDFAWRVNLFSSLCAAGALALLYPTIVRLTRSVAAAVTATVLLAVSHTFWMHAVIAEVYALYALLLAAELYCVERFVATRRTGWLDAAAAFNGLNLCNHLLALLHWPGYLACVWLTRRAARLTWRNAVAAAMFWLAGASLFLSMIAGHIAAGEAPLDVLREALTGKQYLRNMTGGGFSWRGDALKTAAAFMLNFPTPLVLLAIPGAARLWRDAARRPFAAFALSLVAINFVFGFAYTVPDKYVFFFPCYMLVPLLAGVGAAGWMESAWHGHPARAELAESPYHPMMDAGERTANSSTWRVICCLILAAAPALIYEIAPPLLARRNLGLATVRDLPGRDKYAYFIRPRKNAGDGSRAAVIRAVHAVGPGGLLLADSTVKAALVCLREAEGIGTDVVLAEQGDPVPKLPAAAITPANLKRYADAGKAFAFDATPGYLLPGWIEQDYAFEPAGPIFRLVPRKGPMSAPALNSIVAPASSR